MLPSSLVKPTSFHSGPVLPQGDRVQSLALEQLWLMGCCPAPALASTREHLLEKLGGGGQQQGFRCNRVLKASCAPGISRALSPHPHTTDLGCHHGSHLTDEETEPGRSARGPIAGWGQNQDLNGGLRSSEPESFSWAVMDALPLPPGTPSCPKLVPSVPALPLTLIPPHCGEPGTTLSES